MGDRSGREGSPHDVARPGPRLGADRSLIERAGRQAAPGALGNRLFDGDVEAGERRLRESSRLERLLDVQPEVGDVGHELRVCLCLIEAAHDAEADADVVLPHEAGNDGVEGTLVGRNLVLWTKNDQFDPETAASTGQGLVGGFENLSLPTTRSFGANLNIIF